MATLAVYRCGLLRGSCSHVALAVATGGARRPAAEPGPRGVLTASNAPCEADACEDDEPIMELDENSLVALGARVDACEAVLRRLEAAMHEDAHCARGDLVALDASAAQQMGDAVLTCGRAVVMACDKVSTCLGKLVVCSVRNPKERSMKLECEVAVVKKEVRGQRAAPGTPPLPAVPPFPVLAPAPAEPAAERDRPLDDALHFAELHEATRSQSFQAEFIALLQTTASVEAAGKEEGAGGEAEEALGQKQQG